MKKILTIIFFLGFFVYPSSIMADKIPIQAPQATVKDLIAYYGNMYNVSQETLTRTIKCESGGNPKAVGDKNTSFGLVQIHLIAHPDITKTQALDPAFSVKYLAKSIAEKKGRQWTCIRLLET